MFRPVLNVGMAFSPTETAPPVRGLRAVYDSRSLDREHAEVAQLNPVALRQGGCDGVQDRVDDLLRVPLV